MYLYEEYRARTKNVTLFHFCENRNLKFEDFMAFCLLKFLNQTTKLGFYQNIVSSYYLCVISNILIHIIP